MKKFKKSLIILLVLALMLPFAACGKKDEAPAKGEEKGESNEAVEVAQGVTDTEVLVGNSAAVSGAYAPVGAPFNGGIEAYFKMINEEGGVNGRQIKFTHIDDEFDPAKGKAALQTLVNDRKVFAIVGHFGTPVVAATIDDLKEIGIPTVYFATGIRQMYAENAQGGEKCIFPVQPIYITEGGIMVSRAVGDFDAKKIGVIYTNDDAGKDMLEGAKKKAEELGIELVAEQVAAGATDVSAAVTAIKSADVDFIIGAAIQGTIGTIVKGLAAQGVDKDVITTYVNTANVIAEQVYGDIQGKFDVYSNGWVDLAADDGKALELYQKWVDPQYADNVYAITGWIAGHYFTEGLKAVGDKPLTWENYIEAMGQQKIQNPFGGMIDFTEGKRLGTTEMNLSKVADVQGAPGWELVKPLQSSEDILQGK